MSSLPSLVTSFLFDQKQASYQDRSQNIPNLAWQAHSSESAILKQLDRKHDSNIDYQIHHDKNNLGWGQNNLLVKAALTFKPLKIFQD